MKFALEQMPGANIYDALYYRKTFSPEIKSRFITIIKKLFEHPLWVQETIQEEIAKTIEEL